MIQNVVSLTLCFLKTTTMQSSIFILWFSVTSRKAATPQIEFFETILNDYKLLVIIAKSCGKPPVVDCG